MRCAEPGHHLARQQLTGAAGIATVDVSPDGRVVAFVSLARLPAADANTADDVYVLDRATGAIKLESVTATGRGSDGSSQHPRLSADGRFLFVREGGNQTLRIFRLDLATGARQFWKELVPPDPAVLVDIGSDPGQIRLTPDGTSYVYTYWTFEGELYVAQGLR